MDAKKQLEQIVGKDLMAEIPKLTSALEPEKESFKVMGDSNGINTDFEVLDVEVMYDSDKNKLMADVWMYFGKSSEFSVVQVELLQDNILIAKNTLASTLDTTQDILVSGAAKKSVNAEDIKVHVTALAKNKAQNAATYDEVFQAGYVMGMSDVVKEVKVQDPRNIKTPPNTTIHVSFDRKAQLQTVDYDYTDYRAETGRQEVYLDMSGDICLNDGYEYVDNSYMTDRIFLQSEDEICVYANSEASVKKNSPQSIHYEYNKAWICNIPKNVKGASSAANLRSQVTFKFREKSTGKESTCIVVISSKDYALGNAPNNYKKIPDILFYWGCLEENTNITMADGSSKKIKDIQIGDIVLGTDKTACEVRNVIQGEEDMLFCITLESGKEILLTGDHPFMTQSGAKAAIELEHGDKILTESGYEIIEGAYPSYKKYNVCSIDISPSGFIWGNGIAVGDFDNQGKSIKALEEKKKQRVSGEIVAECEKINEKLHQVY